MSFVFLGEKVYMQRVGALVVCDRTIIPLEGDLLHYFIF